MNYKKQPVLKPQDLVVTLGLALCNEGQPSFKKLSQSLHISASEVHGATMRAVASRLLVRIDNTFRVNKTVLCDFLLHGAQIAFPYVEGPIARGMPTGVSSPAMQLHFNQHGLVPLVWPDSKGEARGASICPLYATVPAACREDSRLYQALAAFDAIRGGAAREREMANTIIRNLLS